MTDLTITQTTTQVEDTPQVVEKKDIDTLDRIHSLRQELAGSLIKLDGCLSRITDGKAVRKSATEARSHLLIVKKQTTDMRDELFNLYRHEIKNGKPKPTPAETPVPVEVAEVIVPPAPSEPIDIPMSKTTPVSKRRAKVTKLI